MASFFFFFLDARGKKYTYMHVGRMNACADGGGGRASHQRLSYPLQYVLCIVDVQVEARAAKKKMQKRCREARKRERE
jgi:hypothetical protein